MSEKYLTAAMDSVLAYQLGLIARSPQLHDPINIGDEIDRGLILRRLLEERGFGLVRLTQRAVDLLPCGHPKSSLVQLRFGSLPYCEDCKRAIVRSGHLKSEEMEEIVAELYVCDTCSHVELEETGECPVQRGNK